MNKTKRPNQFAQPWTAGEDQQVRNLHQDGKSIREIARRLDRSKDSVVRRLKFLRVGKAQPVLHTASTEEITKDFSADSAEITSRTYRIKTLEQLLAETKVDLNVWVVERWVANKWEVGASNKEGGIHVEPLWQVKAWLVPKSSKVDRLSLFTDALDHAVKALTVRKPVCLRSACPLKPRSITDGHLMEFGIPDLHLGKLCWKSETGQANYDTKTAENAQLLAIKTLLSYASSYPIERIVYPIGNDFFNVDSDAQTTTGGTPQNEDGRWQKSFAAGEALIVETVDRLRTIAPVDIIVVPGNHDRQRIYYLGALLAAAFKTAKDVTVDNSPSMRKYYVFGKCLIGFTHGDKEKPAALPNLMAQERPVLWAATRFWEWHLGHIHRKADKLFAPLSEENGVRMRYLPSLSPADAWHAQQGYISLRAAELFLWHGQNGMVANFSYSPPVE